MKNLHSLSDMSFKFTEKEKLAMAAICFRWKHYRFRIKPEDGLWRVVQYRDISYSGEWHNLDTSTVTEWSSINKERREFNPEWIIA